MSKSQAVARLESLLTRVRARAGEPRAKAAPQAPVLPVLPAAAAHPPVAIAFPAVVAEALHVPPSAFEAAPPVAAASSPIFDLDDPDSDLDSTDARPVPFRPGPTRTDADIVLDVEVQASTQETVIAVPVEEGAVPDALDSRERLVAAEPSHVPPAPVDVPGLAPASADVQEPALQLEEAPTSSRRPVTPPPEERLDEMAFGNVEPKPPRHTPPPESGQLPAAPEVEFEGDITGVRSASRSAPPSAPLSIVPEATLVDLQASVRLGAVADVVGVVAAPAPTTFLAVLDLSIAL